MCIDEGFCVFTGICDGMITKLKQFQGGQVLHNVCLFVVSSIIEIGFTPLCHFRHNIAEMKLQTKVLKLCINSMKMLYKQQSLIQGWIV